MTIREAINLARQLKQISPTNYPDALMLQFINECEGKIQTEFLRISEIDCQRYTEDDLDKPLIVSPPHDKLYYSYLCAMIDFTNGEYNKYQNAIVIANSFMAEWAAWFNRTHRRDGREYQGVFLSAYGIAVKWGFVGTEEEWLASLVGPQGDTGAPFTYDMFTEKQLEGLRGPQGPVGPKGDKGDTGDRGPQGPQGIPGNVDFEALTPEQLEMLKGDTGPAGADGFTPKITANEAADGYNLLIQNKNGLEMITIKNGKDGNQGPAGKNGSDGAPGSDGADGVGIKSVVQTELSTEDQGRNTMRVTKTDGSTTDFYVFNGRQGSAGPSGKNGKDGERGPVGPAGADGKDGSRGTGILKVAAAPDAYTTATAGKTPVARMDIAAIKLQAGVSEVLVGDTVAQNYYQYHIYYMDATWAYMDTKTSIRGATGSTGPQGPQGIQGAQGIPGSDGNPGHPGFSPIVAVTEIDGGHNVMIEDQEGGHSFDVMDGKDGSAGKDGVTFTPSVSSAGVISWTNDGGKQNPSSVNIKGPAGSDGKDGKTPYIGGNGNWWIGDMDTGVTASGGGGSGGASVQADWGENDETKLSFVNGRTHWKEESGSDDVILDVEATFTGTGALVTGLIGRAIEAGQTYIVTWNGVEHECVGRASETGETFLGNRKLFDGVDDTGEHFAVIPYGTGTQYYLYKASTEGKTNTVKVQGKKVVIWHKIEPEYLPEGVPYFEEGVVELLSVTAGVDPDTGFFVLSTKSIDVAVGENITINYNGNDYVCETLGGISFQGMDLVWAAGNTPALMGTGNTGEPFVVAALGEMVGLIALDGSVSASVAISKNCKIAHKLPTKLQERQVKIFYFRPSNYSDDYPTIHEIQDEVFNAIRSDEDVVLCLCAGASKTYYRLNGFSDYDDGATANFVQFASSASNVANVHFIRLTENGVPERYFLVINVAQKVDGEL